MFISNSARFSCIPGSEPIHLNLEKQFLLSDSMESLKFQSPNKNKTFPYQDPFWEHLEMSSLNSLFGDLFREFGRGILGGVRDYFGEVLGGFW